MEGTGGVGGLTPGAAVHLARTAGWGGAMARSFLAALGRPRWWSIALAAFLLRGGVLVVVLPIVALPTIATLTSLASPTLFAIAFGNPPPDMVAAYTVAGAILAAWLVLAAVLGAWLDLALVEEAALDEDLELAPRRLAGPLRRAAAVRVLAHLPTLGVAVYAVVRVVFETYSEILAPGDSAVPLAWRIAHRVPDAIVLLAGTWLAGESVGGLAVRRVAGGDGIWRALLVGLRRLARPSGLATLVVSNTAVAASLVPLWLATSRTWDQARHLLVDDAPAPLLVAALMLLVATWVLGLALLGAGLAWRSAAWTAEAYRTRPVPATQAALAEAVTA